MNEKKENNKTNDVGAEILLPILNEEQIEVANNDDSTTWAARVMELNTTGDLSVQKGGMVILQIADDKTARCIRVHGHEEGLWLLAMIRETFIAAGYNFQIDPYTLVKPILGWMDGGQSRSAPKESEPIENVKPEDETNVIGACNKAANNIGMEVA